MSYLNVISQYVRGDSAVSDVAHVSIGIPQGSVLGSVLFIRFMNDLPKVINNCWVSMFADDVTLYATGKEDLKLQEDLKCVLTWFRKYRLFVNPSKSSCLLVGTLQRIRHHSFKINGIILEQVEFVKLLGIYIDCSLTWKYN